MKKLFLAMVLSALTFSPRVTLAADFMGFSLGQPFDLTECKWEGEGYLAKYVFIFDQPARPCWQHSILKARPGEPLNSSSSFQVNFLPESSKSPRGVQSGPSLIVVDGKVEGVIAPTTGYRDQEHLLGLLTEKYGKPTKAQAEPVQNLAGSTFTSHTATWQLPGAEVTFNGLGGSIDFGLIQVLSPTAKRYLEDEAAREKSSAPTF